jgi:MoxR-like ATPase
METILVDAPQTIGDTGIRRTLLEELALKSLYLNGEMSLAELAERTCLSLPVVEELFQFFRREQLCEVKGMVRGTHVVVASSAGKERAAASFAFNQYAGPAPVSLDEYSARVHAQGVQGTEVGPADLARAFESLVLGEELVARLGTAVVSGRSVFLYGPSGTGKTTLACNLPAVYDDFVLIPQAIEVDGQVISVYDPVVHRLSPYSMPDDWDRRWMLCHRPRVVAGGELSSEMLDLQFNASTRFFTAPLQLKANNGVLVLDDFGRQRMRSDELLNRWMTPLDRRVDFLTLPGGKKFEVPFDVLVVFSTNIDPRTLADEAFLRRIPNKIHVDYASPTQFAKIFRRACAAHMLASEEDLAEYAAEFITSEMKQPLSHSFAGDIVEQVLWSAKYRGIDPQLTRDTFQQACANYFLEIRSTPE